MFHEICVSGTVGGPLLRQKFPHLHVRKPKTVVVETVLVILCKKAILLQNLTAQFVVYMLCEIGFFSIMYQSVLIYFV